MYRIYFGEGRAFEANDEVIQEDAVILTNN